MNLTPDEQQIFDGKNGNTLQKIMQSVVKYGDIFGADRLVKITHNPHLVLSSGIGLLKPLYRMLGEIDKSDLKIDRPFTLDPYPIDHRNVKSNIAQKAIFLILYNKQKQLDAFYQKIGRKDINAYSCACYLPEVGNIPRFGDIMAWSESSAVVFANSVLGARTNRNSAGIDLLMNILGKTPRCDLLTEEGRKAMWLIDIRTSHKPNPQLLGSAIGMKVMEDVPYIIGLDKFLDRTVLEKNYSYLKDFGAASASNGAVGLYHIENITPEARAQGKSLLKSNFQTYIIDEAELSRIYSIYPNIWKKPEEYPKKCFIGCPHLSLDQIYWWTDHLAVALGEKKVALETILLTAPDIITKFKADKQSYRNLMNTGAKLSKTCPVMYLANPLCDEIPIVTNSNKLRTYSRARFFEDELLLKIIKTGKIPMNEVTK